MKVLSNELQQHGHTYDSTW